MPFSVRLGKRWWSLTQVQPLATMLAYGGYLQRAVNEEGKEIGDAATEALQAAWHPILETPFLSGVSDVLKMTQQEGKLRGVVEQTIASFVPNLIAGISRSTDPVVRDKVTLSDRILERIPFASRSLPARPDDVGGMEIKREHTPFSTFVQGSFDVFGSRPDRTKEDPLIAEMQEVHANIGRLRQYKDLGETDAQYRRRRQATGVIVKLALERVMGSAEYQMLMRYDPEEAAKKLGIPLAQARILLREERKNMLQDASTLVRRELGDLFRAELGR